MMSQESGKNERKVRQGQDNNKNMHQNQDYNKNNSQRNQDINMNEQQSQDYDRFTHFGLDNKMTERSIFHDLHDHRRNERKSEDQEKDIVTEIKEVPVTMERRAPKDLFETLGNAGLPRATIAASKEVPRGTPGSSTNKTVLQQHVEFWDTNNDGIISPLDTWKGFRKLGFGIALSTFFSSVIHTGFSYPTQKSWIPFFGNPFFNIYVNALNKAKHGSDSETYDTEGRFIPEKFEETFSKYDRENKGALNFKDITRLIRGNANLMDPFGWTAASFEWGVLYLLCAKDGEVCKEDVRTCYDGTLFFKMEEEEEKRSKGVLIIKSSTSVKEE